MNSIVFFYQMEKKIIQTILRNFELKQTIREKYLSLLIYKKIQN
jgi:hypothetical protein